MTAPPDAGTLLAIDAEYRRKAETSLLHTIAPRRVVRGREPECLAYYRSPAASILEPSLSASEG